MPGRKKSGSNGAPQKPAAQSRKPRAGAKSAPDAGLWKGQLIEGMLANMADGVVVQDADLRIVECNPAASRILGIERDTLLGMGHDDPSWDVVKEDGAPLLPCDYPQSRTLSTGRPVTGMQIGVRKKDGVLVWISVSSAPLFEPGGAVPHAVVSTFTDITERIYAQEMLEMMVQERTEAHVKLNKTLEQEVVERRKAEEALREAYDGLEAQIAERTLELQDLTTRLEFSVEEHKNSEARVSAMFMAANVAILTIDSMGIIQDANPATGRLFGWPAGKMIGSNISMVMPEPHKSRHDGYLKSYRERDGKGPGTIIGTIREVQGVNANGDMLDLSLSVNEVSVGGRKLFLGIISDITALKAHERRLRLSSKLFESTSEAVMVTDPTAVIVEVNPAFSEITGYSPEEVVGQTPRFMKSGRHGPEFYRAMWRSLIDTGRWQGEVWDRRKSGEIYPKWLSISAVRDEKGEVTHYVGLFNDITRMKQAEERLEHLAHYDVLTGLPNRLLLNDRLKLAISKAEREGRSVALMLLDLDEFKRINDTMGHGVGDELLEAVARRLTGCVRATDTISRLGGDEFTIILPEIEQPEDAAVIAQKFHDSLLLPFQLSGKEVFISASIGISIFPDDGKTNEELLKTADAAMYHAKERGRNTFQFFTEEINVQAMRKLELESRLRKAVERREFYLEFQPRISARTGEIVAAEALVRWRSPEGVVMPGEFIHLAEETGLIIPIGEWVLREACRRCLAWNKGRANPVKVSVNVSLRQFHMHDAVRDVAQALRETGLQPSLLEVELTESILMQDVEVGMRTIEGFRLMGVSATIDDFGTGYSSLNYLRRLPLDGLKIDRSFVSGLPSNRGDAAVVEAIATLGKSLGLRLIAEGIENEEQRMVLDTLGCDEYQGYLFGKPLPMDEFEAHLG